MMIDLGHFSLVAALIASAYGLSASVFGAVWDRRDCTSSAINSIHLSSFFSLIALLSLVYAFVCHDFSYLYVWQNSDHRMSLAYLISAVWGGMEGSLLLWAVLMSLTASVQFRRGNSCFQERKILAPLFSAANLFFFVLVVFYANPLRFVEGAVPSIGQGLNPLLQNPLMIVHPPLLYLGLVTSFVPFAFVLAGLICGRLELSFCSESRRGALFSWIFLSGGIILGAYWAYIELGWGGFWAWDPVENASFMPWLTATALLHCFAVQERQPLFRPIALALAGATYLLTVLGVFITRSGVIQSVHAFTGSNLGPLILCYLGVSVILFLSLIVWRRRSLFDLQFKNSLTRADPILFLGVVFLCLICISTLVGTIFPLVADIFFGKKLTLGIPFFNQVTVPLFVVVLVLCLVSAKRRWLLVQKAIGKSAYMVLTFALLLGALSTVLPHRSTAMLVIGLSSCVMLFSVFDLFRSRRELTQRKVGAVVAHCGFALAALAIAASFGFRSERSIAIKPGQTVEVGRFNLKFVGFHGRKEASYEAVSAAIEVFNRGSSRLVGQLFPENRLYYSHDQVMSEVGIRMTPLADVYVGIVNYGQGQGASRKNALLTVLVNPLQIWVWIGLLIMLAGVALACSSS